jgi:Holliday junction DNA helicase RuvA
MIGKLRGVIDSVGVDTAIIDVNGVGYVVYCPVATLASFVPGAEATVHVETVLREDMLRLYGFATAVELEWFRLLQTVQGVGAKVALALLATLTGGEMSAAVAAQDHKAFAKASGVGPRLGQRIAAELKDRIPDHLADAAAVADPVPGDPTTVTEAISALSNLGYGRAEAMAAVRKAVEEHGAGLAVGVLIRHALKAASAR